MEMNTTATSSLTEEEAYPKPEVAILFFGLALILGALCKQVFARTPVPYTVALLIIGIILGTIDENAHDGLGTLGESIQMWANIEPSLILFIFLPALLFESSMSLEIHQVRKCIWQMALLAAPGVLINTFILGALLKYAFPYSWSWSLSLTLGSLLSATDPVAVVALLRELGASKKLSTIIEGESLMNDGTAIVVFRLFYRIVEGSAFNFGNTIVYFLRVAGGGIAIGIGFGLAAVLWLGFVFNDTLIEITITLTSAYMVYFVCEDKAELSGVIAVLFLGITFAAFANTAFTGENKKSLHYFWEMVAYMANTLIFILSGVIIAEAILRSTASIEGRDWGYLILLYVFVQLARAVVVGACYPLLTRMGYGLNWKEASVMTWAGLRGAVALTLALTIDRNYDVVIDANGKPHGVTPKNQARVLFFTGGVVFLTLVINGSTTKKLLSLLRMDKMTESKLRILEYAKREMHDRAVQSYVEVGEDDEELGPAHWPSVQKLVTYLRKEEFPEVANPFGGVLTDQTDEMRRMRMRDARVRFLRGVQAAYWDLLDQDRLSQYEAILLIQSVDRGLDDETELGDWDELKPYMKLPTWLKMIQRGLNQCSPNTLVNSLVVGSLERGCSMAAGYLRAHHQARLQLRDFLGNNELADEVIRESLKDEAQARAFLDDVGMSFPQVLTSVKTQQVAFHVLRELTTYVEELDEAGLIDTREIVHLHDVVQKDLKKLRRAPLLIRPQHAMGILRSTPLGKHVPEHFEQIVRRDARERTYLRNAVLYKEGSVGQEVYIVGTGLAKVITVDTADGERTVSHFILGSGSILGLYEALAGNRAKLSSAVADSVSLCYVLDRNRLIDIVKSDVRLAEYLWKESAVILSRLVLKRTVEHLTLQKIRLIIMENSRLQHFDEGDAVNIRYGEVLILLEGSLKNTKGFTLVAPVGLAPDVSALFAGPLDTVQLKSELRYTAETSSRVLFIPLGTHIHHAPATIPEDHPKPLTRRALSENEATITASKEMAAKLKEALLLEQPEAARRSMVDLRKPPGGPTMSRKPSGKRVGDMNRSPLGPSRRASLEEGGLLRSLPRPPSRAHLRPLAGLGVQMSLSREPSFTQGMSRGNSSGHRSGFLDGGSATPEELHVAPVEEGDDLEAIIVDSGEDLFSEKRR